MEGVIKKRSQIEVVAGIEYDVTPKHKKTPINRGFYVVPHEVKST